MLKYISASLVLLSFVNFSSAQLASKNIFCYYEGWAAQTSPPENINVNICTHINYAFLGIQANGSLHWLETDDSVVKRVSKLKRVNRNLKLLVSIGGWNEGSLNFSAVANDTKKSNIFANEISNFIKKYNFDGVDIDNEYPGERGADPKLDFDNFAKFLKILKKKLGTTHLVTVTVSPNPRGGAYNVPAINQAVDFVNVMTYDMYVDSSPLAGHNSPLFPLPTDPAWDKEIGNVAIAISNWIGNGTNNSKMILGLPFYSHSFKLADPKNPHILANASGPGTFSGSYQTLCNVTNHFTSKNWTYVFDPIRRVPYMYNNEQIVVYDNEQSIRDKVLYANVMGLGGVMMWAVDQDARQKWGCTPLLNVIQKYINVK